MIEEEKKLKYNEFVAERKSEASHNARFLMACCATTKKPIYFNDSTY